MVTICEVYRQRGIECGIPVILWVEIFFILYLGSQIIMNALFLFVLHHDWNGRMKYLIASYIVFAIIILAWTIYGYVLYFGSDNDCQDHAGTSAWLITMAIILVLILLLWLILLCCVLPIIIFVLILGVG